MKKDKKPITHIEVYVEDKEKLIAMRDKEGYASIKIVLEKLLNKGAKK